MRGRAQRLLRRRKENYEKKIYEGDIFFSFDEFREFFINNPVFFGALILEKEVLDYTNYSFPSRRSLEESISSFILGEREINRDSSGDYFWRNNNLKNLISLNQHGDLYASQTDISGKEWVNLFLEPEFDTLKINPKAKKIGAYQDWSSFLISTLKYSEKIGKSRMPEIVNWKNVLNETGSIGTSTTESLGGTNNSLEFIIDSPIMVKEEKLTSFPLKVHDQVSSFWPYVEDNKLIYLSVDEKGEPIDCLKDTSFNEVNFSRTITYDKDDLPHILKATYKFFARDRSLLPKIMGWFLEKADKSIS